MVTRNQTLMNRNRYSEKGIDVPSRFGSMNGSKENLKKDMAHKWAQPVIFSPF